MKSHHTIDEFDFSLDDRLKRLRQIWKQFIVNPSGEKPMRKSKKGKNPDSASTDPQDGSREKPSKKKPAVTPGAAATAAAMALVSNVPSTADSSLDPGGDGLPLLGVESETGQGLRCSLENCGKLFRNDHLLHQHVKHYHPDVFDHMFASISTPAGSPPSAGINNMSTSLSAAPAEVTSPDLAFACQIREESMKRKSLSIDSTPNFEHVVAKKRKLSLGFNDDDVERPKKLIRALDRSRDRNKQNQPNKKFSFSDASSPINNNDVFDLNNVGRTRNDSVLSVGSGSVAPSEDGDHDGSVFAMSKASRNLPPTPPTFRLSKRRQAQLLVDSDKNSRRRMCLSLGTSEEVSFRGPLSSPDATPSTSGYYPFPSNVSSYPPSEVDMSVTSEHLTTEEVVNCECRRKEEDGLMIQCDICLCWQHGICLGIDDEDQVPDKHICETCRNPAAGRTSARFSIDYDWLKEGRLPTMMTTVKVEPGCGCGGGDGAFKKLSDLMADLANLNKVLHSLRVKLQVASQSNNAKVFMWSMLWDEPPSIRQTPGVDEVTETSFDDNAFMTETDSNFGSGKFDAQAVIDKLKFRLSEAATAAGGGDLFSNVPQEPEAFPNSSSEFCANTQMFLSNNVSDSRLGPSSSDSSHNFSLNFGQNNSQSSAKADQSTEMSNKENESITTNGESVDQGEAAACQDQGSEKKLNDKDRLSSSSPEVKPEPVAEIDPADPEDGLQLEGDSTAFDPSLIPTVSEVAQLLPSVIEAMGSAEGPGHESPIPNLPPPPPPPPPRVFIQEPKRLDRDECRLNLLDHIGSVQTELEARLESIEASLTEIVADDATATNSLPPTSTTRSMLTTVLRDLSTARRLLWSLK